MHSAVKLIYMLKRCLLDGVGEFLTLTLVLLLASPAHSQLHPKIIPSPVSSITGEPTITAVYPDRSGNLWVGTQQGLYRIDGATSEYFSTSKSSPIRLPYSYVTGITEIHKGKILIGTYGGGLFEIDYINRSVEPYKSAIPKSHRYIKSFYRFRDSLILSSQHGGTLVSIRSGEILTLSDLEIVGASQITDENGSSLQAPAVIFATSEGIYSLDQRQRAVEKLFVAESQRKITAMSALSADAIYFTTDDNRLNKLSILDRTVTGSALLPLDSSTHVTEIHQLKNYIWIVSDEGLLGVTGSFDITHFFNTENSQLSNSHISTITVEADHLWVGTYQGLNQLIFSPFHSFSKTQGSLFEDTLAFAEHHRGDIYIGTYKGLLKLAEQSKSHEQLRFDASELGDSVPIISLEIDQDKLYIGTWRRGLYIKDLKSQEILAAPIPKNSELAITAIDASDSERIWVSTYDSGLYELDRKLKLGKRHLAEEAVISFHRSESEAIYISTKNAVYKYQKSLGVFEPLDITFESIDRFPLVLSLSELGPDRLLIGTKDFGLYSAQLADNESLKLHAKPVHHTETRDLLSINSIEIDTSGYIWLATQNGLVRYRNDLTRPTRFTESHGLHGDDFNSGSSLLAKNGALYFGGPQGYTSFDPRSLHMDRSSSKFSLTSITIKDKNGQSSIISPEVERLELPFDHHSITFTFAVHNFLDPWNSDYRFIMENFDPDWTNSGRRAYATYNTLPPGSYIFRAEGADSTGTIADSPVSLQILVARSKYLSPWALMIYAALILLTLSALMYIRVIYTQRKNALSAATSIEKAKSLLELEYSDLQDLQENVLRDAHETNASLLTVLNQFFSRSTGDDRQAITRGIQTLAVLMSHCHFKGMQLLVDFRSSIEEIINMHLLATNTRAERVVTINKVSECSVTPAVAARLALPASEILYQLISNSDTTGPELHYFELEHDSDALLNNVVGLTITHHGPRTSHQYLASTLSDKDAYIRRAILTDSCSLIVRCPDDNIAIAQILTNCDEAFADTG